MFYYWSTIEQYGLLKNGSGEISAAILNHCELWMLLLDYALQIGPNLVWGVSSAFF